MVYSLIYLVLFKHVMCHIKKDTVFWKVKSSSVVENYLMYQRSVLLPSRVRTEIACSLNRH
jgi:hypothetical protein